DGAEQAIAPVGLPAADACQVQKPAEHFAVPLLFADEQLDGAGIVAVADLFGIAGGGGAEMGAVGGLAELPGLKGTGDGDQLRLGHVGAAVPGNGAGMVGVGAKIIEPLGAGERSGAVEPLRVPLADGGRRAVKAL